MTSGLANQIVANQNRTQIHAPLFTNKNLCYRNRLTILNRLVIKKSVLYFNSHEYPLIMWPLNSYFFNTHLFWCLWFFHVYLIGREFKVTFFVFILFILFLSFGFITSVFLLGNYAGLGLREKKSPSVSAFVMTQTHFHNWFENVKSHKMKTMGNDHVSRNYNSLFKPSYDIKLFKQIFWLSVLLSWTNILRELHLNCHRTHRRHLMMWLWNDLHGHGMPDEKGRTREAYTRS